MSWGDMFSSERVAGSRSISKKTFFTVHTARDDNFASTNRPSIGDRPEGLGLHDEW